jgi:cyclase
MSFDRRDFLKLSSLAVPAALLPIRSLLAQGGGGSFQELRRNVGAFHGRGGTIGWLINDDGVVVVDSQFPDTAAQCLEGIRSRSDRPLNALINTHHHGDHTAGNSEFREAAHKIVAHERVPDLQRRSAQQAGSEDRQAYPDTTFSESWTLEVGDEKVRAKHYGNAHTGGDATIFFENANVVHMGDLVFNRFYPFIDRPSGASIQGWIRLLETVTEEHADDTIYIFGHGQEGFGVIGEKADLLHQRDFFTALLDSTQQAIQQGKSKEDVSRIESLRGFENYVGPVEWISLAASFGVAYDELTEE